MTSKLDNAIFPEVQNRNNLGTLLLPLGGVEITFLPRTDYDVRDQKIVKKDDSDEYTLFLPEDLKYSELFSIINTIVQEEGFINTTELIEQMRVDFSTKVHNILGGDPPTEALPFTDYGIDLLIQKIESCDESSQQQEILGVLTQFFYKLLFMKSMDMLRHNLKTLTREEFVSIEEKKQHLKVGEKINTTSVVVANLKDTEEFLRDYIGIDKYKDELHNLRAGVSNGNALILKKQEVTNKPHLKVDEKINTNTVVEKNFKKVEESLRDYILIDKYNNEVGLSNRHALIFKEHEVTNKIIHTLHTMYPFQDLYNSAGSFPRQIITHKGMACVGFSFIIHAFLSELGIDHKCLGFRNHSALQVTIGGAEYYADVGYREFQQLSGEGKDKYYSLDAKLLMALGFPREEEDVESMLLQQMWNNLCAYLINEEKNYDAVLSLCHQRIAVYPNDYLGYTNMGICLEKLLRFDEAIDAFNKSIEINSNYTPAHCLMGNVFFKLLRFDEAIAAYQKSIEINSNYAPAHCLMGNVFYKLGDYPKAIAAYKKSIEINSNYALAYYNMGNALSKSGQRKKAILYKFCSLLLKGKNNNLFFLYPEHKQAIKSFIDDQDFERLKEYMFTLSE